MLQHAIDYLSLTIPQSDLSKPITVTASTIIVRSGSTVAVVGDPHRWFLALIRFVGEKGAAAAVTNSDPSLFGRFGAVLSVGRDGKPFKLLRYGMSASFAASVAKPKRRLLLDVSEAQKIPPAHGRKSSRVDNSAVLEATS